MKQAALLFLSLVALTVMASGLYGFFMPFIPTAMALHVVFGFIFFFSVGVHLYERRKLFIKIFRLKNYSRYTAISLFVYVLLLFSGFELWAPVKMLLSFAYESRHSAEVFRSQPDVVYDKIDHQHRVIKQTEEFETLLEVHLNETNEDLFLAIWAEDDHGNMIEPLFISESLSYSHASREQILPVWSHRFKNMKQEPKDVDEVSSATIKRSFRLNNMIKNRKHGFHIKIEINALEDENDLYHSKSDNFLLKSPEGIGQPSVIYSSFIDFHNELVDTWFLLKFEGKSDVSGEEGDIIPDSYGLTTARQLLERAMLKVDFVSHL